MILRLLRALILVCIFVGLGPLLGGWALASGWLGGELTYAALGNNQYRVTAYLYRDCTGIVVGTLALECRPGTCGGSAAISSTMTAGTPVACPQFCSALASPCAATAVNNMLVFPYETTVTLPPGAWVLSVQDNGTGNIGKTSTTNVAPGAFYLEATLNSQPGGAGGAVVANTSAVTSVTPQYYLAWQQRARLSNSAFDADGDSLVYALDAPLGACNTPYAFVAYPQTGTVVLEPNPLCVYQPTMPTAYTAALPIAVISDTLGSCPLKTSGAPRFSMNARTGGIALQPAFFIPNAGMTAPDNKYSVAVKISEYRRLNGLYVLVGTTRRELVYQVYNAGPNQMPVVAANVTVQGAGGTSALQPASQIVAVAAGQSATVLLTATDANAGQPLTWSLAYNATPGASIQPLNGGQARLTFAPPASMAPGLYRVAVTAEDNACPIKGLDSQVLTFRVSSGAALATRTGLKLAVEAYPNPFAEQVQFKLAQAGVQTLIICDNLGRTVANVRSEADGTVRWQPGAEVPAGLYLARTANGTQTVRLLRSAQ